MSDEFLVLLACGRARSELQSFLVDELTAKVRLFNRVDAKHLHSGEMGTSMLILKQEWKSDCESKFIGQFSTF